VVLELELIVLVVDQVLGAVVRAAVRRVDGVTGSGRGRVAHTGAVAVADGPVADVLALDHVGRYRRPAARVLRYPVVVYRARADALLGLLVRHRSILQEHAAAAVHRVLLFAVHGGRGADDVRRLQLLLAAVFLVRRRVLGIRVRTDFALDHFAAAAAAAAVIVGIVILLLLLLLLDGRMPFVGLTVGRSAGNSDDCAHDDQDRNTRPWFR